MIVYLGYDQRQEYTEGAYQELPFEIMHIIAEGPGGFVGARRIEHDKSEAGQNYDYSKKVVVIKRP